MIKSPTELFDLVFAAYNLSFISPRVVCLRLYVKGRCTRFQQRALFTVLYSWFKHCTKDVSTLTAQPTILEYGAREGRLGRPGPDRPDKQDLCSKTCSKQNWVKSGETGRKAWFCKKVLIWFMLLSKRP